MSIDIVNDLENKQIECISIGKLSDDVFNSIKKHAPEFSDKIQNRTVLFWRDRIEHLNKHKNDANKLSVEEMLVVIPDIIKQPDYIGIKNKDNRQSLQLIKRLDNGFLVAIRLNDKGNLSFRTAYSVTDSQIESYLYKNSLWKFTLDK